MYERIIEIIVYMITELRVNSEISERSISELEDLGYSTSEISTALSWIADGVATNDNAFVKYLENSEHSFRVLNDIEKDLLTPEAWGELIQLTSLKILNIEHIEAIIERVTFLGIRKLDKAQLKSVVASIVFNEQVTNSPSNKWILDSFDTVH